MFGRKFRGQEAILVLGDIFVFVRDQLMPWSMSEV
jgi:hypothetical protein